MGEKIPEMEEIFTVRMLACLAERTQQMGEILFKDMSEKLSRTHGRKAPIISRAHHILDKINDKKVLP